MIGGTVGELPASELHAVEDKLREILRSDVPQGRGRRIRRRLAE
jgi:hypothetical protein